MEIKVAHHTYKVEFCDDLGDYAGLFYGNKKIIRILKDADDVKGTIIHEVTHAYLWAHGHDGSFSMNNEMTCTFFEHFGELIINDANEIMAEWEHAYGKK